MSTRQLLYQTEYPINEKIHIIIPSVGQILDDEDSYYGMVSNLTSTPRDMLVQLDDAGIDFTKINDYELFLLLFAGLAAQDTSLIFGDLDLSKFKLEEDVDSNMIVLIDRTNNIKIDRLIYMQIASVLRKIHGLEKNIRKPANEEAKAYLLERARAKQKRNKNRKQDSQLESLIVAMVNTEQFKYDYDSVLNLTIYQFNQSVHQIIHKIDVDHTLNGVYAGTVDPKKISSDKLNWLSHK